jgi:hypothetical protein
VPLHSQAVVREPSYDHELPVISGAGRSFAAAASGSGIYRVRRSGDKCILPVPQLVLASRRLRPIRYA